MTINLRESFEKWKISPLNKLWNYMAYPAFVGGGEATLATIEPTLRRALEALEFYASPDEYIRERRGPSGENWYECDEGIASVAEGAIAELKQLLGDDDAK